MCIINLDADTPKPSRKRQKHPESWKKNILKKLRESGDKYTNRSGKIIVPRKMKPPCANTCFYLCTKFFNENDRSNIFNDFWSLSDNDKNQFYLKFVKQIPVKRHRTSSQTKLFTYHYYFNLNEEIRRVCRTFFVNTLAIDQKRVYYSFNNLCLPCSKTPLPRKKGKHKKTFTSEEKLDEIRRHIKAFPIIDSHYCRATSGRKYLEAGLSVAKMYNYYVEETPMPLKVNMYRKIFNEEFNLSFWLPKKDLCNKCVLFKMNSNPTADEIHSNDLHKAEKNMAKAERDMDRTNMDPNHCIICFDLQNVITVPKGNSSIFFYKRKLNVYNLTAMTIIPDKEKITYCAIWTEAQTGRGGNDLANAIIKLLNKICLDNPNLKKITFWSDSCIPQNRNKIMSTALKYFLQNSNSLVELLQKFSEPGHSLLQEVDCVHSVIEKHLKNLDIHSPVHLLKLLLNLNYPKIKLDILQIQQKNCVSYTVPATKLSFIKFPFSKIKMIRYQKSEPFLLEYKDSFSNLDFKKVNIKKIANKKVLATPLNLFLCKPPVLQERPILSKEKKDDLKSLIPFLPLPDQNYFKTILNITN